MRYCTCSASLKGALRRRSKVRRRNGRSGGCCGHAPRPAGGFRAPHKCASKGEAHTSSLKHGGTLKSVRAMGWPWATLLQECGRPPWTTAAPLTLRHEGKKKKSEESECEMETEKCRYTLSMGGEPRLAQTRVGRSGECAAHYRFGILFLYRVSATFKPVDQRGEGRDSAGSDGCGKYGSFRCATMKIFGWLVLLLIAIPVAWLGSAFVYETANGYVHRFRLTVEVDTPDGPKRGSGVLQSAWTRKAGWIHAVCG